MELLRFSVQSATIDSEFLWEGMRVIWAVVIVLLLLLAAYSAYRQVFYVDKSRLPAPQHLLEGDQYEPFREDFHGLIEKALSLSFEEVYIESDGLKLYGRYYHSADGAPLQILFHGYRSNAYRDFCGGLDLALHAGHNAILVDQRAHGKSEGKCLSFGVLERKDVLSWVNYAISRFGADTKIVLSGVSMGAATVLMAAELPLPENVVGIMADCGYSSPREIIRKVMAERHYPVPVMYPFVRLGGLVYGGFDIESASAIHSLQKAKIPVLLIHGEDDRFVPCDMSRDMAKACASDVTILTVPGAGHGLSYMVDHPAYVQHVQEFCKKLNLEESI